MSRCKIMAIANQKGGTAKTTTALNLGIGLAQEGKKVLLLDLDPQGNLTMCLGQSCPDEIEITTTEVMRSIIEDKNDLVPSNYIMHNEGVDYIPSDIRLSGLETVLVNTLNRESILKYLLDDIGGDYDYIIADCSPSLGMLTINALVAADSVLIPLQAQYLSAKGIELLIQSITRVKKRSNPKLTIEGILFTMIDKRTTTTDEVIQMIDEAYGQHIRIFETMIPVSATAVKASGMGQSAFAYAPRQKLAHAYGGLVKEVLGDE